MVGIADALADLLIKFCDLGQKRFTGKVRNICNADKYIGEKAGGKDGKGSSCQLFIDNIQNFVSKGISVFVIDIYFSAFPLSKQTARTITRRQT